MKIKNYEKVIFQSRDAIYFKEYKSSIDILMMLSNNEFPFMLAFILVFLIQGVAVALPVYFATQR